MRGAWAGATSSPSTFNQDAEPLYQAGVSTLIHAADSADVRYADTTAASAIPSAGNVGFVPWGPAHSQALNTAENQLVTGKAGGASKALNNHYRAQIVEPNPGWDTDQPAPEWDLMGAAKQAVTKTHVIRSQMKIVPASAPFSSPVASKGLIFILASVGQTSSPHYKWDSDVVAQNLPSGKHTAWLPINGYTDEINAYPTGHDQGINPVGPYFDDLINTWMRMTWLWRPHSAAGVYDGRMAQWVNGTRVIDISTATLHVTPPGGTKQWCGESVLQNLSVNVQNDGGTSTINLSFGGPETCFSQQAWDMVVNLGDGDPTNLDTWTWWTV